MGTLQGESVNPVSGILAELGLEIASVVVSFIQSSLGKVWRTDQGSEGETNWTTLELHNIFLAACKSVKVKNSLPPPLNKNDFSH